MDFSKLSASLITNAFKLLSTALASTDLDENSDDNDNSKPSTKAPGLLVKGSELRAKDPDVDHQTWDKFRRDNRDFSFSLIDELRAAEGDYQNLFLSPCSVSLALALIYGGARGITKSEISEAMHFLLPDEDLHNSFNKLDLELATRSKITPDTKENVAFALDIVNQAWGHNIFPFHPDYLDLLSLNYGAGLYAVDFESDYEEIRADINQWVEERTQERITDLLPKGSLTAETRLILVNAIYFYGSWKHPFDSRLTIDEEFHLLDDTTVDVPMMRHSPPLNTLYFEDDKTLAISLPYVGDDVSMIAYMPANQRDSFLVWEANFDRQRFDDMIAGLHHQEGMVRFPRFEDEGDFSLVSPLQELEMMDAFERHFADFTGIYLPTEASNLFISDIFHRTFVRVDEEGTEAAATTAGAVMRSTGTPNLTFDVTFNRPFYYMIYDHPTDTILFMGYMVDPS